MIIITTPESNTLINENEVITVTNNREKKTVRLYLTDKRIQDFRDVESVRYTANQPIDFMVRSGEFEQTLKRAAIAEERLRNLRLCYITLYDVMRNISKVDPHHPHPEAALEDILYASQRAITYVDETNESARQKGIVPMVEEKNPAPSV